MYLIRSDGSIVGGPVAIAEIFRLSKLHLGSYVIFSILVKLGDFTAGWLAVVTGCLDVETSVMPFVRRNHMGLISNSIPSGSSRESHLESMP
jgi:hypothetical protein